jgi:predicted ABC-type sugar transport system permease subunit
MKAFRKSRIRGLSTAELVGIIVVIGILGALGGTLVTNMVTTGNNNAGKQRAQDLTAALNAAVQGGVDVGVGSSHAIDTTTAQTAISALNPPGIVSGTWTYVLQPPIQNPASYQLDNATNVFTFIRGSTP